MEFFVQEKDLSSIKVISFLDVVWVFDCFLQQIVNMLGFVVRGSAMGFFAIWIFAFPKKVQETRCIILHNTFDRAVTHGAYVADLD